MQPKIENQFKLMITQLQKQGKYCEKHVPDSLKINKNQKRITIKFEKKNKHEKPIPKHMTNYYHLSHFLM